MGMWHTMCFVVLRASTSHGGGTCGHVHLIDARTGQQPTVKLNLPPPYGPHNLSSTFMNRSLIFLPVYRLFTPNQGYVPEPYDPKAAADLSRPTRLLSTARRTASQPAWVKERAAFKPSKSSNKSGYIASIAKKGIYRATLSRPSSRR